MENAHKAVLQKMLCPKQEIFQPDKLQPTRGFAQFLRNATQESPIKDFQRTNKCRCRGTILFI